MPSHHTALATTTTAAPPASSSTGALAGFAAATAVQSPTVLPRSALNNAATQQRAYYYHHDGQPVAAVSSSNGSSNNHAHIISTLAYQQQQHPGIAVSSYSPGALPRTSSLLPPPHLKSVQSSGRYTPPAFQKPFNAPRTFNSVSADPLSESDAPPSKSRPSRSSSAGGIPESVRSNLNRWSNSTTSSRTSNVVAHRRTSSLGRRMSIDAVAVPIIQTSATAVTYQSPRKLQKIRPSTAGSPRPASAASRVRQQSPAPLPPLTSLPPIVALPSLEQEVKGGSPSLAGRDPPQQRPRYYRSPHTDGAIYHWDDTIATPVDSFQVDIQTQQSPARGGTMPSTRNGDGVQQYKGHSRNRSQNTKGSADSGKSPQTANKTPSQKAMLSKALQKANTAVQLDNATNITGAREAYAEACDLLQQVLARTTGEEDRRKLEAIRKTYTTRISELDRLGPPVNTNRDRPLPRRPDSREREEKAATQQNRADDSDEEVVIGTATVTRIMTDDGTDSRPVAPVYSSPARARAAFTPGPPDIPIYASNSNVTEQYTLQSSFSKAVVPRRDPNVNGISLQPPHIDSQIVPPPLSPRRPPSPAKPAELDNPLDIPIQADFVSISAAQRATPESTFTKGHARGNSHESTSWLDPIDESGGSAASSVHSRSSSMRVRRKHIRAASGDTEAEFDAALDDAIEAAYDDGYEPMEAGELTHYEEDGDAVVARAMRKVELAKERVRESEQEALALATEREKRLREQLEQQEREEMEEFGEPEDFYDGNDSDEDEEERILEEMTHGYAIEDFAFGPLQTKAGMIPRASDSSEFTNRTWHSSMASNPPTATTVMTTLSTVSENTVVPVLSKGATSMMPPPPSQALPQLPTQPPRAAPPEQSPTKESVRNRRLSGQNPKELKIETTKLVPNAASPTKAPAVVTVTAAPATTAPSLQVAPKVPGAAGFVAQQRQALSAASSRAPSALSKRVPSPALVPSPAEPFPPPTPPLPPGALQDFDGRSGSPSVGRPGLRKNFSSSSLKSMKSRNLSVTAVDEAGSDVSPGTPLNPQFANSRLPAMPSLPTPVATAFKERMAASGGTGGLYLFENDFHSPNSPGSPNPMVQDGPTALEPCPTDFLLRPFWLMRCLYQTLAHPRGGYLSNKLFVPRDVWKVKGVKLKNVEEKIASCDLLTAALMKLAKVDTCDADAMLIEMQLLDGVFDQVQSVLSRRLGNEVGVQGSGAMFKDATNGDADVSSVPRSSSVSGKPSSFSWRRLRSKNSSAGLSGSYSMSGGGERKGSIADGVGVTVPSLPMTSRPTSKPTKREVASLQFSGPNAHYMSALAKLFDAAQAIDQIARQVDDPGLRHSNQTQVGLELCTRHASEFFGFYICRFVLSDLTMLLDKFVKRGSEWVLV